MSSVEALSTTSTSKSAAGSVWTERLFRALPRYSARLCVQIVALIRGAGFPEIVVLLESVLARSRKTGHSILPHIPTTSKLVPDARAAPRSPSNVGNARPGPYTETSEAARSMSENMVIERGSQARSGDAALAPTVTRWLERSRRACR